MGLYLFADYKFLHYNKNYLFSLALALVVLCYGFFLEHRYPSFNGRGFVQIGMALPVFLLLVQRPFRYIFKAIMKREPVVDKPAPSVADFIYMFAIWMSVCSIIMWIS